MRKENGGLLLGPYERGAPCCYMDGPSDQSEYELLPGGPRPSRPPYRDGDWRVLPSAKSASRKSIMAPSPLCQRFADHRSRLGEAELLAQRRPFLRRHCRWRCGVAIGRVDRRGRTLDRHDGRRSPPLRALRHARLSQSEERRSLCQVQSIVFGEIYISFVDPRMPDNSLASFSKSATDMAVPDGLFGEATKVVTAPWAAISKSTGNL